MKKENIVLVLIAGICLILSGMAIGHGFYKARKTDRYVTVKGLAEQEVKANLAIWPITFIVADNDLAVLQKEIERSRKVIYDFLLEYGFEAEQISYAAPKMRDTKTEDMYGRDIKPQYRYIVEATLTTRTDKVELVKKTMEKSAELVGKGVILSAQTWQTPIEFIFTDLNSIKPEMIQKATENARDAAEKFAKDSQSRVGKIRNASQGYFSINDRDRNTPEIKKVRVVATVQYFLVD